MVCTWVPLNAPLMIVLWEQWGSHVNRNGPWYRLEHAAAALNKKGLAPKVKAFLCYPPEDWDNGNFHPAAPVADEYLEAVRPHAYSKDDVGVGTVVRMHRMRPVYLALQMSWTDAGGGERHRCILQENAQMRDETRNADGDAAFGAAGGAVPPSDPKPDVAALPISLSSGPLRTWVQRRGDTTNSGYTDAALRELGAGNTEYGLEGPCFRVDFVGARMCNTFESIHNPSERCNAVTLAPQAPSTFYKPSSDHDTYFKPPPVTPDVPAGANAWARYCDKQVLSNMPAAAGAGHGGAAAGAGHGGAAAAGPIKPSTKRRRKGK